MDLCDKIKLRFVIRVRGLINKHRVGDSVKYIDFILLSLGLLCADACKTKSRKGDLSKENETVESDASELCLVRTSMETGGTVLLPSVCGREGLGLIGTRAATVPVRKIRHNIDFEIRLHEGSPSRVLESYLSKRYNPRIEPNLSPKSRAEVSFGISYEVGSTESLLYFRDQLRVIEHDLSLISQARASIQRERVRLLASKVDDAETQKALKDLDIWEGQLKRYQELIDETLGAIGQDMAATAMLRNLKMTQLADLADDLMSSNPRFSQAIRDNLNAGISDVSKFKGLSNSEKSRIMLELNHYPSAILARGVKPPGYARQASGYSGKPLSLKMKSNPDTGFIPVRTEFTSKVNPKNPEEVAKFQAYSDEALVKIQSDGLPTSIAVPRRQEVGIINEDGLLEGVPVFEVSVTLEGKKHVTWMSQSEIDMAPAEMQVSSILYHADPRSMPESTPQLLEEWKSSSFFSKDDPAASYARFLSSVTGKPVDPLLSPLYVADIDLASIATVKTSPYEETIDLMDVGQGFISTSHQNLIKYKGVGFNQMGLKEQIKHGPEFNNRDFPQRAVIDYPFTLVYRDTKGKGRVEVIERGSPGNPHEHLFASIKSLNDESKLSILTNPADIVANPKDYRAAAVYFTAEQKKSVELYLNDLERSGKTVNGKTASELRRDLFWALP